MKNPVTILHTHRNNHLDISIRVAVQALHRPLCGPRPIAAPPVLIPWPCFAPRKALQAEKRGGGVC